MAVAVHQHHIVTRHLGMPDDLVRGGRAVGDEEQVIGVEDARRIRLGLRHRSGMVEQLPQLLDRVADIGTQHVLAKELVEHLSDRAFQEGHAPRMTRAVPGIGAVIGIVHQRLEKKGGASEFR